jgi:gas vesicle protein
MMALGVGLVAGVAAGLLVAPVQGRQMRQSLRSRADQARDRALALFEEGRRAFRTRYLSGGTGPSTATFGEITQRTSESIAEGRS